MSPSVCPQCSAPLTPDAVLCPHCDYILDTSFLGGDILDGGTAPPMDDESYVSLFAEETGGFLTSPTSEMSRAVFPVDQGVRQRVSAFLEGAAVLEQTGALAPRALSDIERDVLTSINGERPTARIQAVLDHSPHDVDAAIVALAEDGLIRQVGIARTPSASPPNAHHLGASTPLATFEVATPPPAPAAGPVVSLDPLDLIEIEGDSDSDEDDLRIDLEFAEVKTPPETERILDDAPSDESPFEGPTIALERATALAENHSRDNPFSDDTGDDGVFGDAPALPFARDDRPPDWLDGPTSLDMRGAGLDDNELESSSGDDAEDSEVEHAAVSAFNPEFTAELSELDAHDGPSMPIASGVASDVGAGQSEPSQETVVFVTNQAFPIAPPNVDVNDGPSAPSDAAMKPTDDATRNLSMQSSLVLGNDDDDVPASELDLSLVVDSQIAFESVSAEANEWTAGTDDAFEPAESGFDDDDEKTRGDVVGIAAVAVPPDAPTHFPSAEVEGASMLTMPLTSSVDVETHALDPAPAAPAAAPAQTPAQAASEDEDNTLQARNAYLLALSDLREGRSSRAKSLVRVAQKLVPASSLYATVLEHWDQVCARIAAQHDDPLPEELSYFLQAQACDAAQNPQGAIDLVTRALTFAPQNAQLHNYLGVLYAGRMRDAKAALKPLMTAVQLAPDHPDFRHNLRRVLEMDQSSAPVASSALDHRLDDD